MGKGMKSGWSFGAEHGFSGSAGKTMVKGYARGGPIKKADGGPVNAYLPNDTSAVGQPPGARSETVKDTTPGSYPKGPGGPSANRPGTIGVTNGAKWPEDRAENIARQNLRGDQQNGPVGDKTAKAAADGAISRMPMMQKARGGQIGPVKKGALHRDLGIKQGQKIPENKLAAAKHSNNPLERKRAIFAENAKRWQHKAKGGSVETGQAGKLGPDLDVKFPGNHLAYKDGGCVKLAKGGMGRAMGMPKAPIIGMKRMRHPQGMPGAAGAPPTVPGLPAAGTAPMGVPGAPGSPPRVMAKGGKSRC